MCRAQLTPATLLFQDYGYEKLAPVTPETFQAARYNPALLIQAAHSRHLRPTASRSREVAGYSFKLDQAQTAFFIGTARPTAAQGDHVELR